MDSNRSLKDWPKKEIESPLTFRNGLLIAKSRFSNERVPFEIQPKEPMQDPKRGFLAEFRTEVFHQLLYVPRHPLIDLLAAS